MRKERGRYCFLMLNHSVQIFEFEAHYLQNFVYLLSKLSLKSLIKQKKTTVIRKSNFRPENKKRKLNKTSVSGHVIPPLAVHYSWDDGRESKST